MQIYTNIWWSLLDWVEKPLESTVSDKSWFPFVRDFSQSEGTLTFSHHQTYWNKIWNFLERKINFANEYKYKWRENDNSWKFGTGEDNPYHPDLNPEPQPLGSTQNRQNNGNSAEDISQRQEGVPRFLLLLIFELFFFKCLMHNITTNLILLGLMW